MIRPGLRERLEWMASNIYVFYGCGKCVNAEWCDGCKAQTLRANGGFLPTSYKHTTWNPVKRRALEAFIQGHRDAGTDPMVQDVPTVREE